MPGAWTRSAPNARIPPASPDSSDSDNLNPTGDRLVDTDEMSIERIFCGPCGLRVVEDPVDGRSTPTHRGSERTGRQERLLQGRHFGDETRGHGRQTVTDG